MNDTLRYVARDPVHRKFHQNELSFRMVYAFTENFILPLSHDEVVHGKRSLLSQMPGDIWQKFANFAVDLRLSIHDAGQEALVHAGGEFGQWNEWNHDQELDWALFGFPLHDGLRRFVKDLNDVYRSHGKRCTSSTCRPRGFRGSNATTGTTASMRMCAYAKNRNDFRRRGPEFHASPARQLPHRRPCKTGYYHEILNSDADIYGGGNVGNLGGKYSEPITTHGHPQSISLRIPPLGMVILKPCVMELTSNRCRTPGCRFRRQLWGAAPFVARLSRRFHWGTYASLNSI